MSTVPIQPETGRPLGRQHYSRRNGLRLLIAAAVLGSLASIVDWSQVVGYASAARPRWLLLAAALMFVEFLMTAIRWQALLQAVNVHVSFMQSLRSYLKGHVIGYFVPASMVSDVVKGVDINMARPENTGSQAIEVASSIFIERLFSTVTVAVSVMLGLAISPIVVQGEHTEMLVVLGATIVLFCCFSAMFADKVLLLVPETRLQSSPRIHALIRRAQVSMSAYRQRPGLLAGMMLFSFAIQAIRIVPVYMLAVAIGADQAFFLPT